MKAQICQKDLTAARRWGCVLFPNAFRARDPTDLSSVEMEPSMRRGSLLPGTKGHRNADTVGKQVSVWFSLKTQFFNINLGHLLINSLI